MQTIHKFIVSVADDVSVEMPEGAEFCHVASQSMMEIAVWMLVNTEARLVSTPFKVRGTGHPLQGCGNYLGTAVGNPYVWHLFRP